ncbi:MAG: hypothetical protein AAGD28_20265 [Bacteroidota bacterium]
MIIFRKLRPKTKRLKGKNFIVIPAPPNVLNAKYFACGNYVLMWKRRKSIWAYTPARKAIALTIPYLGHPGFRMEWEDVVCNFYDLIDDHRSERRYSQIVRVLNGGLHGFSLLSHLLYLWVLWGYEKIALRKFV